MLAEHFLTAISAPTKPNTGLTKDAGIFLHEFQPFAAQRHIFKKSVTNPNCIAVSRNHVFAAQAEKAIVHVYNRDKGNQEAIIPFQERIHSIALAAEDTVLLLGMESGRVLAWEICSGRLVSTSTSHLQPVTALAVDASSAFFLSGSTDSMIHVWALPSILSFSPDTSRSPIHTLSTHRGAITALACGHSSGVANIAVSISQDKSAIVWDYRNGQALRTYLLPETPTALTLDPADRAFYVAYEDGSLQTVSFFDEVQEMAAIDTLRDGTLSHRPVQPPTKTRFSAESQKLGTAWCLALSWDGTTLLSGHDSGKVVTWDLAKRTYVGTPATLPGPVTNLQFLPPTGFPNEPLPKFKVPAVVKPKHDTGSIDGAEIVPANYALNMQFVGQLSVPALSATESTKARTSEFEEALSHPSFPLSMLEEGIAELETWGAQTHGASASSSDFVSLSAPTDDAEAERVDGLFGGKNDETEDLKRQLASLQRVQKVTFSQLSELRKEKEYFLIKERRQQRKKAAKAKQRLGFANGNEDLDMRDASGHRSSSSASGLNDEGGEDDCVQGASTDEEEDSASASASD